MVEKTINLPTREECYAFWEQYHTPKHIRRHMEQVNRVAMYLARRLHEVGKPVIVDLVDRASLLHDTLRVTEWKTLSFEYFPERPRLEDIRVWEQQRIAIPTNRPHAQVTADIFQKQYPEMARVIALHSIGDTPNVNTWEEKIVNYADRRVSHDRIVTLKERLDEAYARYSHVLPNALERDPKILEAVHAREAEIFSAVGEDPDDLLRRIKQYEVSTANTTSTKTSADSEDRRSISSSSR